MNIFTKLKNFFNMKKKSTNFEKEQYRGTIKQIMKVRGLRAISLANYDAYKKVQPTDDVHSLKIDIQDGYLNLYAYRPTTNRLAGAKMEDVSVDVYRNVYKKVQDIIAEEERIPYNVRKNILVSLNR